MNVLRDKVVAMCEALGFKGAGKWNKQRMEEKLKGLASVADESAWSIEDPELAALLQSVIEAGGEVDVFKDQASLDAAGDDEPAVEKPTAAEAEAEEAAADEPKPKKEKAIKAPKAKKDSDPNVKVTYKGYGAEFKYADGQKIKLLAKENPHRQGSKMAVHYDKLADGMTVAEAVAAVTRSNVHYYVLKKIVGIVG